MQLTDAPTPRAPRLSARCPSFLLPVLLSFLLPVLSSPLVPVPCCSPLPPSDAYESNAKMCITKRMGNVDRATNEIRPGDVESSGGAVRDSARSCYTVDARKLGRERHQLLMGDAPWPCPGPRG